MNDKNLYTKDSIESLDPLTFTRLRPQVYCGDTTYSTQLLIEILSNAIDEFRLGHGDSIEINIVKDTFSVRDYGQGFIPNSFREDNKSILEAAFSVLNTSGKYREDGTYEGTSLGSFGIGSKICNFLSHYLIATTFRDSQFETVTFKEGKFFSRTTGKSNELPGTLVVWNPSEEFFIHTEVEINKIKDLIHTLVCLCPGLKIQLAIDEEEPEYYFSERGLNDLIDSIVKNKEILNHRFYMHSVNDKYKADMILTYTSDYSSTIIPYVNTGLTESGTHITQLKTTITKEFNKFFKKEKWLKDTEDNLTGDNIQEGICIVFNITIPNVAYDAQVKTRVTKIDTRLFIQDVTKNLQIWLQNNKKEIKLIADKAINARRAQNAAKKAREAIRETQKKKKEKVLKFNSKLADCYSKDRQKCEIIIVEGEQ